jgi:NADPH:quinone reductase-like Zn-dependent oxidoreductase
MNPIPSTMKAFQIASFGGPEVEAVVTVDVPKPGPGELLLEVRAASVNPVDYKLRSGKYPPVKQEMLPYTLGRDVCGVVVGRGAGTEAFADGAAVYALLGVDRGGEAEYVIVKASEASPKPRTLDVAAAGAVPLAALTAWQGLFKHGGLTSGGRVLIHAASGGVGHFAVQFAKAKGAYVYATVSTKNVDFVKSLGADEVIDYKTERFEDKARDLDVVYDLVGGETQERSWGVLKKGGILVSTVQPPPPEKAEAHGARGTRYMAEPSPSDLAEIAALIDAGKVRVHVSKTFKLEQAADALKAVEEGHTIGKVVVTMN